MAKQEQLLVHILEKVDKLEEHVSYIRTDQAEMKADLRYHIKRTDLLEEHVKSLKWIKLLSDAINSLLRFLKIIK